MRSVYFNKGTLHRKNKKPSHKKKNQTTHKKKQRKKSPTEKNTNHHIENTTTTQKQKNQHIKLSTTPSPISITPSSASLCLSPPFSFSSIFFFCQPIKSAILSAYRLFWSSPLEEFLLF